MTNFERIKGMSVEEQEKQIQELSKKEYLTEEEKKFVRNYYRSLFLGSLSSEHITVIEI